MTRLLLTSSQVSVLATGTIVFMCTMALFLSGYVIQQRTVSELREAIRAPPPTRQRPKTYLPEQFKDTDSLDDFDRTLFSQYLYEQEYAKEQQQQQPVVVEVAPTEPEPQPESEADVAALSSSSPPADGTGHDHGSVSKEKMALVEELKAQVARQSWAVEHPDPLVKNRIPIDAAERRRLIREEIKRLSSVESKFGYQRRLW